jgi:DNA-binding CsgD family transcriptional regulator
MLDSHDLLADDAARWARLTEKHRACLDLLLDHRTSKQIARILGIAKPTVDQRIAAARVILGANNRGDAAMRYARLRAIYDQITYDPVRLPEHRQIVPSDFANGDPAETAAPYERATLLERPPFGDIWRPDHAPTTRAAMMAVILVLTVLLVLAGLAIGDVLTRLIAG